MLRAFIARLRALRDAHGPSAADSIAAGPTHPPHARWRVAATLALLLTFGMLLTFGIQTVSAQVLLVPEESDDPNAAPRQETLPTPDRNLRRLLNLGRDVAGEGRPGDALQYWQRALLSAGNALSTRDEWRTRTFQDRQYQRFYPLSTEVEHALRQLPETALRRYRLLVDASARAELNRLQTLGEAADQTTTSDEILAEVIGAAFLSSWGDDAAYRLAAQKFDRGDFVGASRLLQRLLDEYPDTDLPRGPLLSRHIIAQSALGDRKGADESFALLDLLPAGTVPPSLKESTQRFYRDSSASGLSAPDSSELGDRRRLSTSHWRPAPPLELPGSQVTETWTRSWLDQVADALRSEDAANNAFTARRIIIRGAGRTITRSPGSAQQPASLLNRWRSERWQPAADILFDSGRMYFATHERVVCCDAASGKTLWMGRRHQPYESVLSRLYANGAASAELGRPPSGQFEVHHFGDRVRHCMTLIRGRLYVLEGAGRQYLPLDADDAQQRPESRLLRMHSGRRTVRNVLACYDAATGKLQWERSLEDDPPRTSGLGGDADAGDPSQADDFAANGTDLAAAQGIGFLNVPVAFRDDLLVPVVFDGELWLYALDGGDGSTRDRTFISDEPPNGCSPWSPVGIAVGGDDVYLATGLGAAVALDAVTKRVLWAVKYPHNGIRSEQNPSRGFNVQAERRLDGFHTDQIIPWQRYLLVAASDSDALMVFDRRDGRLLWESPRQTDDLNSLVQHVVGLAAGRLFLSGPKMIRCCDIETGRILWEHPLESALGRPLLTTKFLLVPDGDRILQFDLQDGRLVKEALFVTASDEPVGNLLTDGNQLMVVGLARVFAVGDLQEELRLLAARIEQEDVAALRKRMKLHLRLDALPAALEDLKAAFEIETRHSSNTAVTHLLDDSEALALAGEHPFELLRLFAWAFGPRQFPAINRFLSASELARRDRQLQQALNRARSLNLRGGAADILEIAPLCDEELVLDAARLAMQSTADSEDLDLFRTALNGRQERRRILALDGLAALERDVALPLVQELLHDDSDAVRLAAAEAAMNFGDRSCLATFGGLLDSEDEAIRTKAVTALTALTGRSTDYIPYAPAEERRLTAAAWRIWIAEYGAAAKLTFPNGKEGRFFNRTLIVQENRNEAFEVDRDGRVLWRKSIASNPTACEGLANGHRLIAFLSNPSKQTAAIIELDAEGEEVWRLKIEKCRPSSVRQLRSGNILIACQMSHRLLEFNRDKQLVWEKKFEKDPVPKDVQEAPNGNLLVAMFKDSLIVEIDREGRTVRELTGLPQPTSVQPLVNGHLLVSLAGAIGGSRVVELDREGKIVWELTGMSRPTDARRLANGHTLVMDTRGVREYNLQGEVVWESVSPGGSGRFSRY